MTKMTISPIGESDYNELLLQAVAEIENARQTVFHVFHLFHSPPMERNKM